MSRAGPLTRCSHENSVEKRSTWSGGNTRLIWPSSERVRRELCEALNAVADGAEAMTQAPAGAPEGTWMRLVVADASEVIAGPIGWLAAAAGPNARSEAKLDG